MPRPSIALMLALLGGCSEPAKTEPTRVAVTSTGAALPADANHQHGRELLVKHECNRCHRGAELKAPPPAKDCVGCHAEILAGRFAAPPDVLAEWRPRVARLPAAPSLDVSRALLKRSWVAQFLLKPHDVRPHLDGTMPRLELTPQDAVDLAAVVGTEDDGRPGPSASLVPEGKALFAAKGCGSCHAFSGTRSTSPSPATAATLAPDLRFARERVPPAKLAAWIKRPSSFSPHATMPDIEVSDHEAEALAAFVLHTPLSAVPPTPIPQRPLLTRRVSWPEVRDKVFRKVCWHCHAQPDFARGDGGPGMSGGFGFGPRQLDLSTYEAVQSGYLDDDGQLVSLFAPTESGRPRLLEVLFNRQRETAGERPSMRGMPLGFPALAADDIQLVESWIAQGRPR